MKLLSDLKRFKEKINTFFLYKEIQPYLPIDKGMIHYWNHRYLTEKNALCHPYVEIAQLLTNTGQHEKANDYYLRYLMDSDDKLVHSLYLQNLLLSSTATNQSLLKAHTEWANKHSKSVPTYTHEHLKTTTARKLRLGYVCHFFNNSISQNCLQPLLKAHDRNKFEIFCYDDGEPMMDYHAYADHWRDSRNVSDQDLAALIYQDKIDILQELNGFCFINRFGALAYRPAPIQINWYNHTSTTGLQCVDYVMSDTVSIQDMDLPYYTEKAYRHHQFIAAIQFNIDRFGKSSTLPYLKNGYITFGYFGSSHKITLPAIHAWSKILKSVPHSKLILKSGTFTHQLYRDVITHHFINEGVSPSQITLDGWSDHETTLKKYEEIDLMLDNIPVSGGSTMFEALIQSIPVVTLMGERWAARSGASVLTTLGHEELIAHSIDDYIHKAVQLAKNINDLKEYRTILRPKMIHSPLTNIQTFYKNFEEAYVTMWNSWQNTGTISCSTK